MGSFEKFNYSLRPSKQVERRIIVEGLLRLWSCSIRVNEYRYLGFGSPFFADFVQFHRYLLIEDMVCVESEEIPKRMEFNSPFEFVTVEMKPVSDVIPGLDRNRPHLIWLDYDYLLNRSILGDITSLASVVAEGSIVIVTVKADIGSPDLVFEKDEDPTPSDLSERKNQILEALNSDLARFAGRQLLRSDLTRKRVGALFLQVLCSAIEEAVSVRRLVSQQLFRFRYADGAQMVTLGVVLGSQSFVEGLRATGVLSGSCFQVGDEELSITVPPLTVREKLWMDQNLTDDTETDDLGFELKSRALRQCKRFNKYYPTYIEALL